MIGRTHEDRRHGSAGQQHIDGSSLSVALVVLTYQRTSHMAANFHFPTGRLKC